jgi:tripartite-type tricarboxylate transporter receptor subunit TctC
MRRRLVAGFGLALLAGLLAVSGASAQSYPAKPIRMLVAYPPGGANDLLARIVGQRLSEAWGQPVVTDNKPGANGLIGTELAAKSAPDGYTLLMGATGTHTINPALYRKLPYDRVRDFQPVTLIASAPVVILVHPSVAARSIAELVALAKAKPGALNYGAGASLFNLTMELFKSRTGADLVYVPYRGSVPVLTDLIAGQIQVAADVIQTPLPHLREGTLRALAVTSARRSSVAPDVPTMIEAGIAGFEVTAWSGLYVRAGTPEAIVAKLDAEIRKALEDPALREKIHQVGYEERGLGPAEFAALMARETEEFARIVADAHIPKLD